MEEIQTKQTIVFRIFATIVGLFYGVSFCLGIIAVEGVLLNIKNMQNLYADPAPSFFDGTLGIVICVLVVLAVGFLGFWVSRKRIDHQWKLGIGALGGSFIIMIISAIILAVSGISHN